MGKEHVYGGLLPSRKVERSARTHRYPENVYFKWKKADAKCHIFCDSIYTKYPEQEIPQKQKVSVCQGLGGVRGHGEGQLSRCRVSC